MPHTLYNIRLGKPGKGGSLCSLCSCGTIGTPGTTTESRRDLLGEIAHPGIHPVAGTAFICEPPMYGQNHLAGLRLVVQSFVLIAEPQELRFAVAPADIHTQLDECLINDVSERIGLRGVGCTLDGDCPLVVCI